MIKRFDTSPLMSQAVVHGGVAYLAGQVAEGADVPEQARAVLAKVDALLASVGSDKGKLLAATIWLTDMADFAAMNAVWEEWLAPGTAPARATVGAALAFPKYLIEIMVTAAVG